MEAGTPELNNDHQEGVYLCRKCRNQLFTVADLEDHEPRMHTFHKLKARNLDTGVRCTSYFIEEKLSWMGDMSDVEGKLICPNGRCKARVGTYKWVGSQCSCGSWVAPAIQIPMSKVDLKVELGSSVMNIVDASRNASRRNSTSLSEEETHVMELEGCVNIVDGDTKLKEFSSNQSGQSSSEKTNATNEKSLDEEEKDLILCR
mmetsp:Transcript_20371/g.25719  ORF Transcript_20371/g.25719 Transcript_20371/m.25719 type:complete len:203 (-) Transcript_20371:160-768(-)